MAEPPPHTTSAAPDDPESDTARLPYTPPTLEALGPWSARTLQQTIPIGPGGFLGLPPFRNRRTTPADR